MFFNAVFCSVSKVFFFNAGLPPAFGICHIIVPYAITGLTTAVYIILIFVKITFYIEAPRWLIANDRIAIFLSISRKYKPHQSLLLIWMFNILIFFYIKIKLSFIFNNVIILNLFGVFDKYISWYFTDANVILYLRAHFAQAV